MKLAVKLTNVSTRSGLVIPALVKVYVSLDFHVVLNDLLCATTTEFNSTLSLNTLGTIVSNLSLRTAQLACKRISSLIKVLKSQCFLIYPSIIGIS